MRTRAERRKLTKQVRAKRDTEYRNVAGTEPARPGRGKYMSHLTCGNSACGMCHRQRKPIEPFDLDQHL